MRDDILSSIRRELRSSLAPDQVDAISRGKWNEARNGMSPALAQRLVEMGLTDEEAQALLDQEWNALPELAQRRLAMALSEEIGVSPELIEAVMNRDWKSARSYAELEVAEILLSRFLNMSGIHAHRLTREHHLALTCLRRAGTISVAETSL
jgi:hypothetical protein